MRRNGRHARPVGPGLSPAVPGGPGRMHPPAPAGGRRRSPVAMAVALLAAILLSACAGIPEQRAELAEGTTATELDAVPFFPDTAYYCGPASLASTLEWSGYETSPDALGGSLFIPERNGSLQPEMLATARRAGRLAYQIDGRLAAVQRELRAGHPVIVLQNLAFGWWPRWHYAVVVGLYPDDGTVVLRSGERRRHRISFKTFLHTWARAEYWAMVTPAPGGLPATAEPGPLFQALASLEGTAGVEPAIPYWRAAAGRWPESGPYAVGLANAVYAAGDADAARKVLTDALPRVAEGKGVVWNNLANIEAEQGDLAEAEAAAESAVAAGGPHVEQFRDTLADIRCRRGKGACPGAE